MKIILGALALAVLVAGAALAQVSTPGDSAPPQEDVPDLPDLPPAPVPPPGGEVAPPLVPELKPAAGAVLQGLDKVTAQITTLTVPIGGSASFGTLTIHLRACVPSKPDEAPEAAAFLEIVDIRPDQEPVPVFSGWMFASSPALSALEHPVYDIWVKACSTVAPASP